MSDLNSITLSGRLTKDPEFISEKFVKLSIANNQYNAKEKKEKPNFFNVLLIGGVAKMAKYISKGTLIAFTGKLQQSSFKDKNGNNRQSFDIAVMNDLVILQNGKKREKATNQDFEEDLGNIEPDLSSDEFEDPFANLDMDE